MSRIKARKWFGGSRILVEQKGVSFSYVKPGVKDIKREGRHLDICVFSKTGHSQMTNVTIGLSGTQINTLKKILKAAYEI